MWGLVYFYKLFLQPCCSAPDDHNYKVISWRDEGIYQKQTIKNDRNNILTQFNIFKWKAIFVLVSQLSILKIHMILHIL